MSPHFPPLNAPDMQRARQALPYLREHGWEPVVLAVDPGYAGSGVMDPLLEQTYPADIRVVRVRGLAPGRTRWLGIGSLWWRCGAALRRAGEALLSSERFDLVFFTTTQFDVFTLGPRWHRRFGVPYVLDYQDPWVNTHYHETNTRPPGGWIKFGFTQWLARRREPQVVREAAGIVVVSEAYEHNLTKAYPSLGREKFTLLPFGVATADFEVAARHRPAHPLIDFADGNLHFVYTGRCVPNMAPALLALFRAFRRFLDSNAAEATRIRWHFIGTDYAPPPVGREWVMPSARAEGVADFVTEQCYRVPYFDALHYLIKADALVIIGSTDAGYTASKFFPYILTQHPLLVVFHQASLVTKLARQFGLKPVEFPSNPQMSDLAEQIFQAWFANHRYSVPSGVRAVDLAPYRADALTAQLSRVFDSACRRATPT